MLTVEKRWAGGFLPEAKDERNAVEFLLDLCFKLATWSPDDLHLQRSGDLLSVDFVHMRVAHDLLHPWLNTAEKVGKIEAGLQTLGLRLEVRLKGKTLASIGQGGSSAILPVLLGGLGS